MLRGFNAFLIWDEVFLQLELLSVYCSTSVVVVVVAAVLVVVAAVTTTTSTTTTTIIITKQHTHTL